MEPKQPYDGPPHTAATYSVDGGIATITLSQPDNKNALSTELVDALGDLEDAIAAAAELAELGEDYTVRYVEKELDFTQRLLSDMTAGVLQHAGIQASEATPLRAMLRDLEAQADELARFNDPNHIYAWSTLSND